MSCFKILFNQDRHWVYPYECEKIENYFIICAKNKGICLDSEVSENIIEKTCRELGVNQKQLAEKTGYARETLSRWKSSNDIPKSAENHLILLMKYNKFKEVEDLIKLN